MIRIKKIAALFVLLTTCVLTTQGAFSETISCSSTVDMNSLSNMLFKSENIHGGRGMTLLDQGHRLGGARTLKVAGANKKVIGCFGLWACDRPFGCRYYQAMCHDGTSHSAFITKARRNGGSTVLVSKGSGTCYSFNASSSRYGHIVK